MAQNLDELTLKIEADASEANAALDGLIGKLGELSKALTQVKGNTKINVTTKQVQSLSHSVDNSSRAATRFGAAFRKSFSTLGNYTKTVAKFGLTVGKGMFIGTPTAMAKGMMALGKGTASAVSGFTKLVTGAKNTKEQFESLITTVGSLVIKFTVLKKIFGTLWDATSKAMNFIETFHYFDRSFDKIGEDSVNSWAQAGYDSAEAYANSFKDRALELTRKMSGFNIDRETGEATSTGQVNLGLDPNMLLNYQAQFGQMANGLGMTSEAALQTSKALTMLGADWSALRNIGFEESYTKMASALAGQTRAVRSLGVDISVATLQQYAYNAGLTTSVSKLDGAAKAELRMIAILDQSRVAWGDMATTLNTPANQYRLLTQNVNTLARAIGNIFLPVVQKVLPYINGLVIALQRLFVWLGKFLGIKSEGGGATGGMSDAFADMADYSDDAASGTDAIADAADGANDALGNAADTAEKLKNTILGFDELNVLNSPNESSSSGTGGSGSGGSGTGGATGMNPGDMGLLDNALSSLMDEYEAAWQKALDGLSNKAQEIADKIVAAFTSKDWNGLGKTIADLLWKGIRAIGEFFEPDFINPYIEEITTGIAGTINGFFDPSNPLWADLGWSIANVLNAGIRFANELYDKTLFDSIGHSLGISFLGLVKDFDAYGLGRLIMQKFSAAVSILEGFLEEMQGQWDLVGQKVEQFILGAMSMINPEQIANVINLAVEGATDFLGGIGWENLGTEIGTRLEKLILNVDPHKIAGLISMAIKSALQLAKGFLEKMKDTWDDLGTKVGTLLAEALKGIPTSDLEIVVSDAMMAVLDFLSSGINEFRKEGGFEDLAEKTGALINAAFADQEKWTKLGEAIRGFFKGSLSFLLRLSKIIEWKDIGTNVHTFVKNAIDDDELWNDLGTTLKAWCEGIITFMTNALPQTKEEWAAFGTRIAELLEMVPWKDVFELVKNTIITATEGIWEGLGTTTAGKVVRGMGLLVIGWDLIGPFVKAIGMALIGDRVIKHLAWHLSAALGAGLTTGATNAAAQVSANTGLKLFSGSIAGVLGSAAAIVGIGYAFLEACHTIQLGVETLQGGNGKATDEGNAIDGLIKAMQTFNALSPGQSEQLWKMKEDMESAGASSEEVFNAIIGKMGEWQISSGDMERALAIIKENGWLTDEMVAQLSTHIGDLKTDSDIAASGMENLYSKMDFSSYGTNPIEDFYSLEEIVGRVGTATGLSADQMTSLSTALYAQNPASLTAQAAYDLICGKVEEMDGNVSGVADVFSILFPNAVKTGTDSAKTDISTMATEVSGSASTMATNVSSSMSTIERTMGDSASRARTQQIREMKQAHTESSKEMEGLEKDVSGSVSKMETEVDTKSGESKDAITAAFDESATNVSTNTGTMNTDTYNNMKLQFGQVKFFTDAAKTYMSRKWGDIVADMRDVQMANLNSTVQTGMSNVLTTVQSYVSQIAGSLSGLTESFRSAGASAAQALSNGLISQHISIPRIDWNWHTIYYGEGDWVQIPNFWVTWNAKGGLFTEPTVLQGFGEAGDEAALPLENKAVMARIASAIVDASPTGMGMSADDMSDAVATGVAMALAQNPQTVEVIVQSILKTDDEALAQSVSRGRARLDQRYNATPSYSY